jgi:hypothetical protein
MNCAKVDWCLPSIIQCDSALNEMASMYINGDNDCGLNKRHIPVYSEIDDRGKNMKANFQRFWST